MHSKTSRLLAFSLAAGILGCLLRLALYRFGFDEKNILSATHPLHLVCLALTGFMAVYLWLTVRKLGGSSDPLANFPASTLRITGTLAAACFMVFHATTLTREITAPLSLIRTCLAFVGAGCMALCVLKPTGSGWLHPLCRSIICAFFAVDMLCRYQNWSGNPQLPDYTFQVLACVLLALTSYHRLAFDTGLGNRRGLLFSSLMGIYLCLLCTAGPETRIFYLAGAFWAGSCMCTAIPPAEDPGQETSDDIST